MSEGIDHTASQAEQEEQFLAQADDFLEKSAAVAEAMDEKEFVTVEPSRMEDRIEPTPDEEEDEEPAPHAGEWRTTPSVKDQAERYPESVKLADPETKILDLSKEEDLKEFNRIQKAAGNTSAPTLAITDLEKQQVNGSWTVFVTFNKVLYHTL